MSLLKEQRLVDYLKNYENLRAIRIMSATKLFNKRFDGSVSKFFRTLKNGLNSFHGIANREYFKSLSGCYFSLIDSAQLEIIIIYDPNKTKLNDIQVSYRIKKLLGLSSSVEFGEYSDFENRILDMVRDRRKSQTFGNFYFSVK